MIKTTQQVEKETKEAIPNWRNYLKNGEITLENQNLGGHHEMDVCMRLF